MSWTFRFININDPNQEYAVMCCGSQWNSSNCNPAVGNCTQMIQAPPGGYVDIKCCPTSVQPPLIAWISAPDWTPWQVVIFDPYGNLAYFCPIVDQDHPCVYQYVTPPYPTPPPPSPSPSPSPSPTPTVTPIPTPTITPPPYSPTPTPTTAPPPPTATLPWYFWALLGAAFGLGIGLIVVEATRQRR